ncbi:MAG: O-antigen ligase family protein [Anditalea sp.]
MCLYLPFYITILSIVYQATGSTVVVSIFQYLKELVLVLGIASFVLYQRDPFRYVLNLNIVDKLFIAFLGLATIYLFLPLGEASFINKLLYLKNTLLMGVLYFLGRNTFFNKGQIALLFTCIMIIAVAAFVLNVFETVVGIHFQNFTGYALFNYVINGMEPTGNYGLAWTFETQTSAMRLASFFSNPLELASSCLLGFSTGLIWYLTTKRQEGGFYVFVMMVSVGSLFFSSSRAAFAAFFIMVFFIALVFKLYRLLAIGALVFALFVLYVLFLASDDFYYFVYDTITFQNASSVGHVLEWLMALESMILNPEGIGLAMSGNVGSVEDELRVGGENQFLIYGVQLGVVGMFLYIAVLLLGISKSLKVFRKSPDVYKARIAFVAAVTKFGLLLPLFTANAELYLYVSLLTWWMLGYSMTEYNQIKASESKSLLPAN